MNDLDDLDHLDPAFDARLRDSLRARADLADGVTVPDVSRVRAEAAPTGHRRRNLLLVAVAVALVVAGVAALLRSPSIRRVDVEPATSVPDRDSVAFVADWLPDGLVVPPGQASGPSSDDTSWTREGRVLGRDGRAEVAVTAVANPLGRSMATYGEQPTTETMVDARRALLSTIDGVVGLDIALRPGLTLSLASRSVGRDALESLSRAFSPSTGAFDRSRLPSGWTEVDDPGRLASVSRRSSAVVRLDGSWSAGVPSVNGTGTNVVTNVTESDQRSVSVSWAPSDDPAGVIGRSFELWGGERVEVGGRSAVIQRVSAPRTVDIVLVAVAIDDHHVAWVQGYGVSKDELLRVAASLRTATPTEWARLRSPDPVTTTVDGIELAGRTPRVVASGAVGGDRWVLATTDPPDGAATDDPVRQYQFVVRHPDGTQSTYGVPFSTVLDPTEFRDGHVVAILAVAPADVTDIGLEQDGGAFDVTSAPVADTDDQIVVALLPSVDVDEATWTSAIRVTGTNADGSPYVPPPPGSGMSFALGQGG